MSFKNKHQVTKLVLDRRALTWETGLCAVRVSHRPVAGNEEVSLKLRPIGSGLYVGTLYLVTGPLISKPVLWCF